jgi:hypothetical protein
MLWFGLQKRLADLEVAHMALEHQFSKLERGIEEHVASLVNAADLYNRASARAERAGINQRTGEPGRHAASGAEDDGLMAVRRRRGGF